MVEISLDIPDNFYDKLNKLSETFSQDVGETINEILSAVSLDMKWLVESKKIDNISLSLRAKLYSRLFSGKWIDLILIDKILNELNAEGHFTASRMEINLDDNRIEVYYNSIQGSSLLVNYFYVTFTGLKRLTADCDIEVDEEKNETRDLIEEHARRIKRIKKELPEEFHELEPWYIDVSLDDASICLRATFSEPAIEYLPSIPAISEFFEKVLTSAGVSRT